MGAILPLFLTVLLAQADRPESTPDLSPELRDRIHRLASELELESLDARDRAMRELIAIGGPAYDAMKSLGESSKDVEVRARATRIAKEVRDALFPRVRAQFLVGSKTAPKEEWKGAGWILQEARRLGYVGIRVDGTEEPPGIAERRSALHSFGSSVTVWGQLIDRTSEASIVGLWDSENAGPTRRITLGGSRPRQLVRLPEGTSGEDLLVALELVGAPTAHDLQRLRDFVRSGLKGTEGEDELDEPRGVGDEALRELFPDVLFYDLIGHPTQALDGPAPARCYRAAFVRRPGLDPAFVIVNSWRDVAPLARSVKTSEDAEAVARALIRLVAPGTCACLGPYGSLSVRELSVKREGEEWAVQGASSWKDEGYPFAVRIGRDGRMESYTHEARKHPH